MKRAWCPVGLVLLIGCAGGPRPRTLPAAIQSIAVPTMVNQTAQIGLEDRLTREVSQEFIRDGRLTIRPREQAQAALEAQITRYVLQPVSYTGNGEVGEYRMWISVNARAVDLTAGGGTLWTVNDLQEEFRYNPRDPRFSTEALAEEEARRTVLEYLARDLVKQTLEGGGAR